MTLFAAMPMALMVGGSLASCLAAVAIAGRAAAPAIVFGMTGPLVSTIASWVVTERTHSSAPARLTSVLITAFAIKAVLFGAYVVVALAVLDLRPIPFLASFTSYYVALHFGEALLLKRLLAHDRS
jgi:hypothetical protein